MYATSAVMIQHRLVKGFLHWSTTRIFPIESTVTFPRPKRAFKWKYIGCGFNWRGMVSARFTYADFQHLILVWSAPETQAKTFSLCKVLSQDKWFSQKRLTSLWPARNSIAPLPISDWDCYSHYYSLHLDGRHITLPGYLLEFDSRDFDGWLVTSHFGIQAHD